MSTTSAVEVAAIASRLAVVQERIARACRRVGRAPESVTLIGVTKTFPVEVAMAAREAGLHHFGENRVQELVDKAAALPGRLEGGDVHWHMIGHLQRNKAKDVVAHADAFHALDSPRLARTLNQKAAEASRVVPCLVQVNISGEESKYGLEPADVDAFLRDLTPHEHLCVEGLMSIAAPADDPETVRPQFRLLRALFDRHAGRPLSNVRMTSLSMGMSGDFEVAIEEGATHVRIGSALFGPRA